MLFNSMYLEVSRLLAARRLLEGITERRIAVLALHFFIHALDSLVPG